MDDLISRQAAIDAVEESRRSNYHQDGKEACAHEYEHRGFLKILHELPPVQPKGFVHIDDIYRLISGHSNYHGDNILAALTCLAEGKKVEHPITVLSVQPEQNEITMEDVKAYCEPRNLVVLTKELFDQMNNTADKIYLYLQDRERR